MGIHPRSALLRIALTLPAALLFVQCAPDSVIKTKDGAEMLLIIEGQFLMGGKEEETADHPQTGYLHLLAERPVHRVKISAFYLDKYEVTNAQYHRFLEDLKKTGDRGVNHPEQPAAMGHEQFRDLVPELWGEQQPAVGLNWYDAYAYCKWAGKRLPTEAEWEYAARGPDTYRTYPWGDAEPFADGIWRANYDASAGRDADTFYHSAPVGSYLDGASPFKLLDLSGNASEWVNDWLGKYTESAETVLNPQGPDSGNHKVLKGGSYYSERWQIRIGVRLYGSPSVKSPNAGVRCARDL